MSIPEVLVACGVHTTRAGQKQDAVSKMPAPTEALGLLSFSALQVGNVAYLQQ